MTDDDWTELEAQVESHGPEAVEFVLENADEKLFVLDINNIQFTDGKIKVSLS